ncbi:hypothetical protein [Parendozoicomonas haliclonae]|uniref:Uncharacterized protein n=1 Tax=Parendozoicomonas haliclonae TaxID=1960125 RepID=A0A1X7AR93_9GAMM|nr:hypothetical protein [Parendozoicomonas haliclonae]SMA50826.1 hypothetical protein EHSB41UT_04643 [Parendozoicomonas haliclonae]
MNLIYNHKQRQGRIVDENHQLIRQLPPHKDTNPAPRFAAASPFHYTQQLLSYLAGLYEEGVLEEQGTEDDMVWALIRICDEDDTAFRDQYQTYHGQVGFLIDEGVIFNEICVEVIEEVF